MKKLTYPPNDLKKIGAHLGLKTPDGVKLMAYDLPDDMYKEDQPLRTVDVAETRWIEALQSLVYVLDQDVVNEDTMETVGKLCIVIPEHLVEDCVKPVDELI
jgi:hypothetical protein